MMTANSLVQLAALIVCTFLSTSADAFKWNFIPSDLHVGIDEVKLVHVIIENSTSDAQQLRENSIIFLRNERPNLAKADAVIRHVETFENGSWLGEFNVTGVFLGFTRITLEWPNSGNGSSQTTLSVTVEKQKGVLDKVFTGSVVVFIAVLFINFGTAIDLSVLRDIITRPVGPAIGFVGQFIFMPLISFGLAFLIFPDTPTLQLGLFFTGISPTGGASTIWTLLLDGNINLSLTMTTMSTFAAFGTMPFWVFTLGKYMFDQSNIQMPYLSIAGSAFGLIIPLTIGILIQKQNPSITKLLLKILKPLSLVMIILLSIFATIVNFYIFKMFTWHIVLAGLALPLCGYIFGWTIGKLFCQSTPDATAISIETGIQNTAIAIFLLASVDQPPIMPIAVATMTSFPLGFIFVIIKIKKWWFSEKKLDDDTKPKIEMTGNVNLAYA